MGIDIKIIQKGSFDKDATFLWFALVSPCSNEFQSTSQISQFDCNICKIKENKIAVVT